MKISYPERACINNIPSFSYKVRESMDKVFYLKKKNIKYGVMQLNNKLFAQKIAEKHNIPIPMVFKSNFCLSDLNIVDDGSYVLKPLYSTNSNGVMLFNKKGECYEGINFESDGSFSFLLKKCYEIMNLKKFKDVWILEELIQSNNNFLNRPDDFKFYCFRGRVGIILQKRNLKNGALYKWYDGNWNIVDCGKYLKSLSNDLELPNNANVMLNNAIKFSKAIKKPFMRVDFLESKEGGVFGELTPHPGGYDKFNAKFDLILGRMWEEVEAEMDLNIYTL